MEGMWREILGDDLSLYELKPVRADRIVPSQNLRSWCCIWPPLRTDSQGLLELELLREGLRLSSLAPQNLRGSCSLAECPPVGH